MKSSTLFMMIIGSTLLGLAVMGMSMPSSIRLEGYKHAVAICNKGAPATMIKIKQVSMKQEKGFFLTINPGHEDDKELINLKAAALVECN